ncbi:MAG TPA: MATE family efflux transporter [Anaerolineales bacterium]|jgi:putative MATE family efflux protein|nr:MATE family efflux transporter [Anaerolineales bacterium]HQX15021.1 MATE family efflux transporter [Anaerolineales bacterium]
MTFLKDKDFIRAALALAVPVAFQQLITAGLNMIDVLMVGQLGETSVAALGLANQIFFLLILFVFGVASGMSIFTAQFWGKGDVESIRKVLGICLSLAVLVAACFSLAAVFIPETLMSFYTEDAEVIKLGSDYLRIVGLSYVLMAISFSYISILRSITQVKLTVIVSVLALALKTALGYSLIFGHFGLPALGVRGAAIGTATGWAFECALLLVLVYARKTPLAANPLTFFHFDRAFLFNVLRTSMPAALNEVIWSFGITFYYAVYARIGTDAIAAININATIEELMFVLFIGLGNACSVMVGNKIGERDKETAFEYSRRFIIVTVAFSALGGALVFFSRGLIAGLYQVSDSARFDLMNIMTVYAFSSWLRAYNFMLFIGAFRAGGDTRYAMFTELFSIWLIGVPAALIGGFILHLPVYDVYALVLLEELVKAIVVTRRYLSRKWIHDLVNAAADSTPLLSTVEPDSASQP